MMKFAKFKLDWLILPLAGFLVAIGIWHIVSQTISKELPSPGKTWAESREYILKPFEKRGEIGT